MSLRAENLRGADAEAAFDRGDQLMTEGRITEACDAFESSNHLEPPAHERAIEVGPNAAANGAGVTLHGTF